MFDTDILTEQTQHHGDLRGPYATHYAGIEHTGRLMMRRLANPPARFATALASALDERASFARHPVGLDAQLLWFGSRLLPGRLLHHLIRLAMRLPRHGALPGRLGSRPTEPTINSSPPGESKQHG
jgi:hypothetical protein